MKIIAPDETVTWMANFLYHKVVNETEWQSLPRFEELPERVKDIWIKKALVYLDSIITRLKIEETQ
jgi:hypothetical protein